MEREACVCDHGYERSDLCAEIIIIIIIITTTASRPISCSSCCHKCNIQGDYKHKPN